nr:hypothetical protein [Hoylesella saccharolytica]
MIRADRSVTPCFNTFYEYLQNVYRKDMEKQDIIDYIGTLRLYEKTSLLIFLVKSPREQIIKNN